MKTMNRTCLLLFACLLACGMARAQSNAYFYGENQNGYSMDLMPGGTDYIAGGTVYRTSATYIHLVRYDQAGFPTAGPPVFIYEQNYDTRLVKLIPYDPKTVIVVAYSRDLSSSTSNIHVMMVNLSIAPPGQVIFSRKIASGSAAYPSLIPNDAIWNFNTNELVVCGTASTSPMPTETDSKVAFVLKTNFTTSTNIFYNTPNGGSGYDYDIATRIVRNAQGNYYVTGSENMYKSALGMNTMGIKSLCLNPTSLATLWNVPLYVNEKGKDNGVDMVQFQGRLNLLVNVEDQGYTWNIIPLGSGNGMPAIASSQHFTGSRCRAHHFLPGDFVSQGDFSVVGMRYDLVPGSCRDTDPDNGVPFVSHVRLAGLPGSVAGTFSYPTIVGTHDPGFSVDYWSLGDFYAPTPSYGLPVYLPKLASRQDPSTSSGEYGFIAPIMNPTMTSLNTKFIFTPRDSRNECDVNICDESFKDRQIFTPGNTTTATSVGAFLSQSSVPTHEYPPYLKYVCPGDPYYRPAAGAGTAGIQNTVPAGQGALYPNPATDRLTVDLKAYSGTDVTVDMAGIDGKTVGTLFRGRAGEQVTYDIPSNLPKGIYLVRIRAGAGQTVHKLVIQ